MPTATASTVKTTWAAAMLSLKNTFNRETVAEFRGLLEVRFPTATFRVAVADGTIAINRGAADDPDAVIETDPTTLEEVAFGLTALDAAEASGALQLRGDRELVSRFFTLFSVEGFARSESGAAHT